MDMAHINQKNQKRNRRYLILVYIGIFLFFSSTLYFTYNYCKNKKQDSENNKKIEEFFEVKDIEDETTTDTEQVVEEEKINIDYFAVLEIPKINLKRGIYNVDSKDNNVDKNIYILKSSTLPNKQDSHIILAAHSGNSYISYFRNLHRVNKNDEVFFYFKNIKYIYKVIDKYEVDKTGKIELEFTDSKDITLITCVHGEEKQLVVVAKIVSQENY